MSKLKRLYMRSSWYPVFNFRNDAGKARSALLETIIPQAIVADVAEEDAIVTGEKREGMFFAARTFAMKMGQSVAMLVFTSLAVLGTTQDLKSNDLTASPIGLRIVAIVAICFCVLGAVILAAYDEKKVMKTINDNADK